MISRQRIEFKIEQKEEEIQELESKIRENRAYVQALQDTLKMLPRDGNQEKALRQGSDMAKARDAILAAGKPLHISEILTALGKEVVKKNRVAVAGSMAGYVRKGAVFTKTAPNTFGLVELATNGTHKEGEEQATE